MRTISEYKILSQIHLDEEEFLSLDTARLIYHDLPGFMEEYRVAVAGAPCPEPDAADAKAVLLNAGAVLSRPHAEANCVHAEPVFADRVRTGYRPPRYGRAALFELPAPEGQGAARGQFEGLLDVKGCGVPAGEIPTAHPMRNGVLFLHDALIELINSILLSRLFERDCVNLSTIPLYAIVDTGVRAKAAWAANRIPCAALVRKALVRQPGHIELPLGGSVEEEIQYSVECYLLSRGLTTVGPITTVCVMREEESFVLRLDGEVVPEATEEMVLYHLNELGLYPPQILHFVNVQIARDASLDPLRACLVDLGHVRACDELPGHLGVFVRDRQLNLGKIVKKGEPGWPRRTPGSAIDHAVFGPQMLFETGMDPELLDWLKPTGSFKAAGSGLLHEALRLAMLVDKGRCAPDELLNEVEDFVDRVLPSR